MRPYPSIAARPIAGLGLTGALLCAACASQPPPAAAKPAARPQQETPTFDAEGLPLDDRQHDDRVERWVDIERHRLLAPVARCVNAPLEMRLSSVPIAWAREIRLEVVSPRPLAITVELVDGDGHPISTRFFNAADTPERTAALAALEHCRADAAAAVADATPAPAPAPPPGRASKKPRRPPVAQKGRAAPPPAPAAKRIRSTETEPLVGLRLATEEERRSGLRRPNAYLLSWLVTPARYANIPPGPLTRFPVISPPDKPIVVRIWSQDVLDLGDVLVTLEDVQLEPVLEVVRYSKLFERRQQLAGQAVLDRTKFCAEHRRDQECWGIPLPHITSSPPPPPPPEVPPPRPSAEHEWIPGSWSWDGQAYVWDAGAWRKLAPPAPIAAAVAPARAPENKPAAPPVAPPHAAATPPPAVASPAHPTLAPAAPVAASPAPAVASPPPLPGPASLPPPPIAERPTPAPATAGTIWIVGFWLWDGRAYRWVPGHWQLPPTRTSRWRPPGWQERAGARIYFPGSWIDVAR